MSAIQSLLASVGCAAVLVLPACTAGTPNQPDPIAPPPSAAASGAARAVLVVQVDSVCAGRESNIRVYIDRVPIGVTNPGEPGVSEMVTVGDHQLSAVSQRGTEWGPFPTTVTIDGHIERLGCMPSGGI